MTSISSSLSIINDSHCIHANSITKNLRPALFRKKLSSYIKMPYTLEMRGFHPVISNKSIKTHIAYNNN